MLNRSVFVCLHALRLNFCELRYVVSVRLLVNQDPELAPEGTLALLFLILASGNRSRGAQTGVAPVHRGLTSVLNLAQVWLTHGSGYSSNSSGPKTEMENAHVEIPISNYLFSMGVGLVQRYLGSLNCHPLCS